MVFPADHRAYVRMGVYKTFPQAQFGTRLLNTFVVPVLNRPFMRSKFDKKFREQMVQSHKRVIAET